MRFDIMCTRIILIPERCEIQPFSTTQFLADATLDILGEVVGIIFALPERHLQHKEPLRCWFKPKCRKTQRHDLARIHGVDDTPAINTITSKTVRMPTPSFCSTRAIISPNTSRPGVFALFDS